MLSAELRVRDGSVGFVDGYFDSLYASPVGEMSSYTVLDTTIPRWPRVSSGLDTAIAFLFNASWKFRKVVYDGHSPFGEILGMSSVFVWKRATMLSILVVVSILNSFSPYFKFIQRLWLIIL